MKTRRGLETSNFKLLVELLAAIFKLRLAFFAPMIKIRFSQAAVAQLDRVSGYEPEGRGFESCQPRQVSWLSRE